jgi:hypothetical protein
MLAGRITKGTIAKGALMTALLSIVVSIPLESALAAKRRLPDGACLVSRRQVVASGSTCMFNCNSLGWCNSKLCSNGQLSALPLLCHSPGNCATIRC